MSRTNLLKFALSHVSSYSAVRKSYLTLKVTFSRQGATLCEKTGLYYFKDHKLNFDNNAKCRLMNPAKSEVGKISKVLLDKINNEVRCKTNLNQ